MADIVNPCLLWLLEVVKTHEVKAEDHICHDFSSLSRQHCREMGGEGVEGSPPCKYYCTPHVMAWLTELTKVLASMFPVQLMCLLVCDLCCTFLPI